MVNLQEDNVKLRDGRYAKRIGLSASIYMSAVLEYVIAEVVDVSGNTARKCKRMRVTPRHITLGVREDAEFHELLRRVTIPDGGVRPHIEPQLNPTKNKRKRSPNPMRSDQTSQTND